MKDNLNKPSQLKALNSFSTKIGSNSLLVQGAGGNTSYKEDGLMWIKASGTWLMNADTQDIMVPVELKPLYAALNNNDSSVENAIQFVPEALNPKQLRPSIETSMHAIMPQRFVIHVHCVETIAHAVRSDCETLLSEKLDGLNYAFIPYFRPGLPLSTGIKQRLKSDTNILILGNHGLVVASNDLNEAKALLDTVSSRLGEKPRATKMIDENALNAKIKDSAYCIADDTVQGVAMDSVALSHASKGSLYPDHVIFLGVGSVVAKPDENIEDVRARHHKIFDSDPVSIIFPDLGVVMLKDANAGAHAMGKCLSDVTLRLSDNAPINVLTDDDHAALLNWDAEKYRQILNME